MQPEPANQITTTNYCKCHSISLLSHRKYIYIYIGINSSSSTSVRWIGSSSPDQWAHQKPNYVDRLFELHVYCGGYYVVKKKGDSIIVEIYVKTYDKITYV